ncbi:MAG: hypothetical protein LC737_06790, partial [Chloroflexi bacterium]|nr:hypothetical protein [Chloroflexota bacterium]
ILRANQSEHLLLKATAVRQLMVMRRVQVEAFCTKHQRPIAEPRVGCGECTRERIKDEGTRLT